jgi:outer membrane lipoprotein SlyB
VRLDDDRTVAIAQLADEGFSIGEQVKLLTSQDGKARVTH